MRYGDADKTNEKQRKLKNGRFLRAVLSIMLFSGLEWYRSGLFLFFAEGD